MINRMNQSDAPLHTLKSDNLPSDEFISEKKHRQKKTWKISGIFGKLNLQSDRMTSFFRRASALALCLITFFWAISGGKIGAESYNHFFSRIEWEFKSSSAVTDGNARIIYDFLISKGLNTAAACGVLANIEKESGFLPSAYNPDDKGSPSAGICQWHGSRFTNMLAFVGDDWETDLEGQLDFLWYELSTISTYKKYVLTTLQSAPNDSSGAFDSGYAWCYYFEVPAGYATGTSDIRGNYAIEYFEAYYEEPTVIYNDVHEGQYIIANGSADGIFSDFQAIGLTSDSLSGGELINLNNIPEHPGRRWYIRKAGEDSQGPYYLIESMLNQDYVLNLFPAYTGEIMAASLGVNIKNTDPYNNGKNQIWRFISENGYVRIVSESDRNMQIAIDITENSESLSLHPSEEENQYVQWSLFNPSAALLEQAERQADGTVILRGWAYDYADLSKSSDISVYDSNGNHVVTFAADKDSEILNDIPAGKHRFEYTLSKSSFPSEGTLRIYAVSGGFGHNICFAQTAVEAPDYYTVNFMDGTEILSTQSVSAGDRATPPEVPSKPGFSFTGWDKYYGKITSDTDITAIWTKKSYTITFSTDGGTEITQQSAVHGEKLARPADPVKSGYDFAGWYNDGEFTQMYDFSSQIIAETVLYARWVPLNSVKGDTDSSGKIDIDDAVFMKRGISGWESFSLYPASADMNRDGKCNIADLVWFKRYFAEWEGYEL